MEKDLAQQAGSFWDGKYVSGRAEGRLIRDWLECDYVRREYINRSMHGNPDWDWVTYLAESHLRPHALRAVLDVGCGEGSVSIALIGAGIAEKSIGVDVSAQGIEAAKGHANAAGIGARAEFMCADILNLDFDGGFFDAIVINMALHHVLDIERLLAKIKRWKAPNAILAIHEYVGPNRFQWTDAARFEGERLLRSLPPKLRVHGISNEIVESLWSPTYRDMLVGDPSEAIRSAEMIDILDCYFERIERRDFGGTILQPLLVDIVHNFEFERDASHRSELDRLFAAERELLRSGRITSNFSFLAYR